MKCDYEHCSVQMTIARITACIGDTQAGAYWGNYCSIDCAQIEINQTWEHLKAGKSLSTIVIKNQIGGIVQNTNNTAITTMNQSLLSTPAPSTTPTPIKAIDDGGMISAQLKPAIFAQVEHKAETIQSDHVAWDVTDQTIASEAIDNEISNATQIAYNLGKKLNNFLNAEITETVAELNVNKYAYSCRLYTLTASHGNAPYHVVIAPFVHGPQNDQIDVVINFPANSKYNAEITIKEVTIDDATIASLASHIKSAGALIVTEGNKSDDEGPKTNDAF